MQTRYGRARGWAYANPWLQHGYVAAIVDVRRSTFVHDHKQAIQHSEPRGGDGEEIEGGDHLTVILQKSEPLLTAITTPDQATQISGYGSFRDGKAKLLQFRVDFGSAPVCILLRQASDQFPHFLADPRPAAARTRPPAPVEPKAGSMPADDGFWLDDQEDVGPAGPDAAERSPKQSVARIQGRPGSLALQYGDLLPKSEDLQSDVTMGTKEDEECIQHGDYDLDHEFTVVPHPGASWMAKPLIPRSDEVLSTHRTPPQLPSEDHRKRLMRKPRLNNSAK